MITFFYPLSLKLENPKNQKVMVKLADEVKAINPAVPSTAIQK